MAAAGPAALLRRWETGIGLNKMYKAKGNHCPFVSIVAVGLLAGGVLRAQDERVDAENCHDSPLITRMPGSKILNCDHKEFEQVKVRTGTNKDNEAIEKTIEGEYWSWEYGVREGVGDFQVFRNFETALRRAGWTIDWSDTPGVGQIIAHKGGTWCVIEVNGSYKQTILTVKAMQQEVAADASQIQDELSKTGHMAIYGIQFETGKAAILPASEGVLAEVQKMLEQNESWRIRIEGHTDNVGQKAANQTLSDKRAQAVMGWLLAHGIDASRLTAKGYGDNKPVADNGAEEGRAKNRRVELAKM